VCCTVCAWHTFKHDNCSSNDAALRLQARDRLWGELSDKARTQFVYPEPGKPRAEDEGAFSQESPSGDKPPLDTFALIVLEVKDVDYTEYFHMGRKCVSLQQDGSWSEQALNP
jgi:pyridoxamine 5'-phosphate oxidase